MEADKLGQLDRTEYRCRLFGQLPILLSTDTDYMKMEPQGRCRTDNVMLWNEWGLWSHFDMDFNPDVAINLSYSFLLC